MRLILVLYPAHHQLYVKVSGEIQGCKTHLAGFGAKFDRKLSSLLALLKVKFCKIIFNFIWLLDFAAGDFAAEKNLAYVFSFIFYYVS